MGTMHLVLEHFDLRICVMNELVHLLAQCVILLGQTLGKMLLINDLLRCLVAVEGQAAACTLHDDCGTKTAQHRGFVVLRWIQTSNDYIVGIVE